VGAQSALGRRDAEIALIRRVLRHLADRVAARLRAKERAGRTVTARVRFTDLRSVTRSVTLPAAVSATAIVAEVAESLVATALADHPDEREISLLAISVSHLVYEPALQLELPLGLEGEERRPGTPRGAARWVLDRSVDAVRDRFGRAAIGYASVALSSEGTVPDAFRELAERKE
jgi:DNA polymerase-4